MLIDRGGGLPTPTETRLSIGGVLGGDAPKGIPSRRWSLTIHHKMSLSTCRDQSTGRCGGSFSVDQLDLRCHWRERIRSLARGTSFSNDDMCPNNTCHRRAGGLGWDRNFFAKERNFCIRVSVGNAQADTVSMITPRYSTDLDGERSDFSMFITMPWSGRV